MTDSVLRFNPVHDIIYAISLILKFASMALPHSADSEKCNVGSKASLCKDQIIVSLEGCWFVDLFFGTALSGAVFGLAQTCLGLFWACLGL